MKCPHCLDSFHQQLVEIDIGKGPEGSWLSNHQMCPECGKSIIFLDRVVDWGVAERRLIYPKGVARSPLPVELDDPHVIEDYNEATIVLPDSAKASAALSRRCLQYILREKGNVKKSDLDSEIQAVLDSNILPSDIANNLDAIRNIGNFASHPIKSKSTGEIVEVEANEAEWNLEVLEQLIDFYYVRPAIAKKKREDLNAKLIAAGKPPLK